jgi:hypothetical protein
MEVSGEAAKFIATDGFTITASAERIKQLGLSIALLRLWAPLSSTSAPLIPSWLNPKHTKTWMLYADKPDAELNAAYALAKAGAGSKYKKVYQDLFNTHLVSCLNTVASAMRSRRLDTMCKVYKHHVSTRTVSGELIVSLTMALSPIVDYEIVREKVCSLNVWQVVQSIFYFFRINVLSARAKQHIFATSFDSYIAFGIHQRKVTGMKPTISIENLSCCFFIFVIAQHDISSTAHNFSGNIFRIG